MIDERSWHRLPTVGTDVAADPHLVLQVLSAVIGEERGEMAGHAFERVELISPQEAVVKFHLRIAGRQTSTTERVRLEGSSLHFEQVDGFLPAVEEEIAVNAMDGHSRLTYSGRYRPRPSILGRMLGPLLAPVIYRREARRTLEAVKRTAEVRQDKSAMFRQQPR